jgi:hypothetical protein
MPLALGISFFFTFTYSTLAAKSRRVVLISLLDVLKDRLAGSFNAT